MKIIEHLNSALTLGLSVESALVGIEERFGIKNSYNEKYSLWVLNYDQIKSSKHKFEKIVCECRSLAINFDGGKFNVVSRSFSRFFNYGEKKVPHRINNLIAYEKLDGSLVTMFNYNGEWLYRTKSMIMPETSINGFGTTWKEIIEEALNFKEVSKGLLGAMCLPESCDFIFEVCSPENRVVTRYKGRTATLLAIRTPLGTYLSPEKCDLIASNYGWNRPKVWTFTNWESCLESAKDLRNLEEGFVMYNSKGVPQCKVKNPAYVAAHFLRGEGILTPKRIVDLILMGEVEEYLSVFPEDTDVLVPYIEAYKAVLKDITLVNSLFSGEPTGELFIATQKDFALTVKNLTIGTVLFTMRKNKELTSLEAFDKITRKAKQQMIEVYLNSLNSLASNNN